MSFYDWLMKPIKTGGNGPIRAVDFPLWRKREDKGASHWHQLLISSGGKNKRISGAKRWRWIVRHSQWAGEEGEGGGGRKGGPLIPWRSWTNEQLQKTLACQVWKKWWGNWMAEFFRRGTSSLALISGAFLILPLSLLQTLAGLVSRLLIAHALPHSLNLAQSHTLLSLSHSPLAPKSFLFPASLISATGMDFLIATLSPIRRTTFSSSSSN